MVEADAASLSAWRQGSVLPEALASRLGLLTETSRCAIVISHDCDIVNAALEPNIELIVARLISTANGTLTHGKSPRTLHITWDHTSGARTLELKASGKLTLPKAQIIGELPDPDYRLPETTAGLFLLRRWLGMRYNRSSFPDEFNARLQRTKIGDDLLRVLKNHPQVTGVYVKLDTLSELAADGLIPYELDIFLAFHPGDQPEEAQSKTDRAAEAIEAAFVKRCYRGDRDIWQLLVLNSCTAISEADFRVAQAKQLQQLTLDYLSLGNTPLGPAPLGVVNR